MAVEDLYERYYAEKIWSMIPEVYRAEDGLALRPNVLRQIVELIGEQAAVTRRSLDRLWEDQHIDTCDDWAISYLGDLVRTRLLPEDDPRGRRVDVARTVHFRRRRGTPSLLEQLVRELSGWDVVMVEAFRRLARASHRLDVFPIPAGKVTGTPRGGFANLKNPRVGELALSPFDELARTPDVRRLRGLKGRLAIGKVNFHVFRTAALGLGGVTPVAFDEGGVVTFTADPSGRDVPLFVPSVPIDNDSLGACKDRAWAMLPPPVALMRGQPTATCERRCVVAEEWQVARPMTCRFFSDAAFQFELADALAKFDIESTANAEEAIRTLSGFRFRNEARLRQRLIDLGVDFTNEPTWYRDFLREFVTDDSLKPRLHGSAFLVDIGDPALKFDEVTGADLSLLGCHPDPSDPGVRLLVDPRLGRFAVLDAGADPPIVERYVYGFVAGVGAGGYTRELADPDGMPITPPVNGDLGAALPAAGTLTLDGSQTYTLELDSSTAIQSSILQSEQQTRPYVLLESDDSGAAADVTPAGPDSRFVVDGVWLGSTDDLREDVVIGRASPSGDFDWDEIVISHSTLDPGGVRADGSRIPTLRIVVVGRVKLLRIVGSVVGPIEVVLDDSPGLSGFVSKIEIADSIVDATQIVPDLFERRTAISNIVGEVHLTGTTVLGDIRAERIFATNSLVMGNLVAVDTQNSCFRFSVAAPGDQNRFPDHFHAQPLDVKPFYFTSLRFGDPGYGQLSVAAPESVRAGASDGGEVGAFSFLRRTAKVASIAAKLDEFKPVGILTQSIFEGESAGGTLAAE